MAHTKNANQTCLRNMQKVLNRPQGLETYFNMHKYTELLTFLTKIRISEYKHIFMHIKVCFEPLWNRPNSHVTLSLFA